jgi:hypothetical protein
MAVSDGALLAFRFIYRVTGEFVANWLTQLAMQASGEIR